MLVVVVIIGGDVGIVKKFVMEEMTLKRKKS